MLEILRPISVVRFVFFFHLKVLSNDSSITICGNQENHENACLGRELTCSRMRRAPEMTMHVMTSLTHANQFLSYARTDSFTTVSESTRRSNSDNVRRVPLT